MRTQYSLLFFSTLLLLISGCTKYDPQYQTIEYEDYLNSSTVKNTAYIHSNDIYLTDPLLSNHKRLTFTPSTYKAKVAFSPNHDKIAYLTYNGTPTIIDTSGNLIATLTQYSSAEDIRWHANNGNPTLVILRNGAFSFYGSVLPLAANPFDYVYPSNSTTREVDAFEITPNFDIIFSYRYIVPYSSYYYTYYGIAVNYASSSSNDKRSNVSDDDIPNGIPYSTINYCRYHWIRYNEENGYVSLGFNKNNTSNHSVYFHDVVYNSTSVYTYSAPIFDCTFAQEHGDDIIYASNSEMYKEFGNYSGPTLYIDKEYTFSTISSSAPTYIDWQP